MEYTMLENDTSVITGTTDGDSKLPDRVLVFCRMRPFISSDAKGETGHCSKLLNVDHEAHQISSDLRPNQPFTFDGILGPESSQDEVYRVVARPVLIDCLRGVEGCIMAYGQTGSGKTHSLLNIGDGKGKTGIGGSAGIVARLATDLFAMTSADLRHVFQVQMAMLQVYNESVDDLLKSRQGLHIKGNSVQGLTWHKCNKPEDLLHCFYNGRRRLKYAETHMNKKSSRSHAILQLKITRRKRNQETNMPPETIISVEEAEGMLTVVDLAGSERQKKSGSTSGDRFKEVTNINTSLLVLGKVVAALASRQKHIPYRDSTLTKLLEPALCGKSRTVMLVCVAPESEHINESTQSLEQASRAMAIPTSATERIGIREMRLEELTSTLAEGFMSEASQAAAEQVEIADARARAAERRLEEEVCRRMQEASSAAQARAEADARLNEMEIAIIRSNEAAEAAIEAGRLATKSNEDRAEAEKRSKLLFQDLSELRNLMEKRTGEASKREESLLSQIQELDKRCRAAEAEATMAKTRLDAEESLYKKEKEELQKALGVASNGAGTVVAAAEAAAEKVRELSNLLIEESGKRAAAQSASEAALSSVSALQAELKSIRDDADTDISCLREVLLDSGIIVTRRSRKGKKLSRVIRYKSESHSIEWMPVITKKANSMKLCDGTTDNHAWAVEEDEGWLQIKGIDRTLDINVHSETIRHFVAALRHKMESEE